MELQRIQSNQPNGQALQNGTPNFTTVFTPNDGNQHLVIVAFKLIVASAMTGGVVGLFVTETGQSIATVASTVAEAAAGVYYFPAGPTTELLCGPAATIAISQTSALTAGAATLFTEIWANE